MRRLLLIFIPAILVLLPGCRTHKRVVSSDFVETRDSISAGLTTKSEILREDFRFSDFVADSIEVVFRADSLKVGESVVYRPEIVKAVKKPKVSVATGGCQEVKSETASSLNAGSHKQSKSDFKDTRETQSYYQWIPFMISVIFILWFFFRWKK